MVSGSMLLLDKPKEWTSFDAVNKIKNLVRKKFSLKKFKIGHSGTLDPMATGLLVVCTGTWTKKLHELQGLDKKYHAVITLGAATNTYDAEGEVVEERPIPQLTVNDIEETLSAFKGEFMQLPPIYSAIKKDGKPLYALARAGKEVTVEPRKVIVHNIELINFSANTIELNIHCGSGFYVRSLAHDVGQRIGCGGHLSALRRTAIGPYSIGEAFQMEEVIAAFK